jgi:predicted outer membrane repeat protein
MLTWFTRSAVLVGIVLSATASAATYVVRPDGRGDFATIQEAIDACENGDLIELTDGTFTGHRNRGLSYWGRLITVRSQSGDPGSCIIDCEGLTNGIRFIAAETEQAVLDGVTVINGIAENGGGLICMNGSSPTIRHCVFADNMATGDQGWGGGVFCVESWPRFEAVTLRHNSSHHVGGGMALRDCMGIQLSHVVFINNTSERYGGGLYCANSEHAEIEYCTFSGNMAQSAQGGGMSVWSCDVVLRNATFVANSADRYGSAIDFHNGGAQVYRTLLAFNLGGAVVFGASSLALVFECSDMYGNMGGDWPSPYSGQLGQNGNMAVDPQYCSSTPDGDRNWTLQSDSPCALAACGVMGAWPVGCATSPTDPLSWGAIKATFRDLATTGGRPHQP